MANDNRDELIFQIVNEQVRKFCRNFVKDPYLCRTEHCQHALFYHMLFKALPQKLREQEFASTGMMRSAQDPRFVRVLSIQKEYPTACNLEKTRRQGWDICVLSPSLGRTTGGPSDAREYDRLRPTVAVEFGLNAGNGHLQEDIRRLSHPGSGLDHGIIVHLVRLSHRGPNMLSQRDKSAESSVLKSGEQGLSMCDWMRQKLSGKPQLSIYYAVADPFDTLTEAQGSAGLWCITHEGVTSVR